jgi:hypothetical protein
MSATPPKRPNVHALPSCSIGVGGSEDRVVDWNPTLWMETLCRFNDRDFIDDKLRIWEWFHVE